MGLKIKKSPKPVTATQKKQSFAKKSTVSPAKKETHKPLTAKKTEKKQSNKKNVTHTVDAPHENVKIQDPLITSKCELQKSSVEGAVGAAFKAFKLNLQKTKGGQLFDSEPHPVNLLVSAIKITNSDAEPFRVKLPNPFLNDECDICLIVKDLEKGWKVDHEKTTQHYQELLQNKNVSFITEVMPLRQLRIEFKPFEARGKLAKRFEVVLVDKRIAKFVPRYLGKAFYQSGKLPVAIDIEAHDLSTEVNRALATSMMSMTNHGASTQMQVGLSNQTEKQIVENIMAVYETMQKNFPGKFANIRSLYIRFGSNPWTVPIYVSFATRDLVTLPVSKKLDEPLIDDLSTLAPGWKVAVYPSGEVKKVKDEGYQHTDLDAAVEDFEAPGTVLELAADEEMSDAEEMSEAEIDEKITETKKSRKAPKIVKTTSKAKASDVEEDEPRNGDKSLKISRKKKPADDSSEDEGDALEEEYMKELDILEGDIVGGDSEEVDDNEEVVEKEVKKADSKLKQIKKKTSKKSNIKKKAKHQA